MRAQTTKENGLQINGMSMEMIESAAIEAIRGYCRRKDFDYPDGGELSILAHDVLTRVWEKKDLYNPVKSSMRTWVSTIATNLFKDSEALRDKQLFKYTPIYLEDEDGDAYFNPRVVAVLSDESEADYSLRKQETQKTKNAIYRKKLRPEDISMLELKEDHYTNTEIAEFMGKTQGCVNTRLHRALSAIREDMYKALRAA